MDAEFHLHLHARTIAPNIPKDCVILYFLVAVSTYNSNYDVKERLSASIFELLFNFYRSAVVANFYMV